MSEDLFDICKNYHGGNSNSIEANKIAHNGKVTAKQRILDELRYDSTCEDLEIVLSLSHQTCSARLSDLKREGKIRVVGQRKTRSGSPASIYQVK